MAISQERAKAVIDSVAGVGLGPGTTTLIPAGFTPTTELSVSYGDKALALGNSFVKSECPGAPKISFPRESSDTSSSRTYTLLLVDPDAPYPNDLKFANWRHWVVTGLRPAEDASSTGETLTAYLGPGPKDDSPPHRYVFQLFREPEGGLAITKADVGGEEFVERRSFNSPEWVKKHRLELVALNWMLCASDAWKE